MTPILFAAIGIVLGLLLMLIATAITLLTVAESPADRRGSGRIDEEAA